jgi:DNA repair photolyase
MKKVKLVKPMYLCQDVPVVVFGKRCLSPCLYCVLNQKTFLQEEIIASGVEKVASALSNYKSAYFSAITDCFLPENSDLTHYLIAEVWKSNPSFVPLLVTKQIIPEKTIKMFVENKNRLVLQISVPGVNQEVISILEPGSAMISERLGMIKTLTEVGVPVIAVIMPWFGFDDPNNLAKELAGAGIKRALVSTAVLDKVSKIKMINHSDSKIKQLVSSFIEEVGHGFVPVFDQKVKSLKDLTNSLQNFGIKARICTYDHPDLSGLEFNLCKKFNHKNFR